jgi:hypothetical protein
VHFIPYMVLKRVGERAEESRDVKFFWSIGHLK